MSDVSKLMSMHAAIAAHVHDGDTVVIEGFTHLICFAAGHEIIRQGRTNLTLARLTPDLIYDQMIAAGCARKLVFSWAGNPGVGSLHAFRRAGEGQAGPPLELGENSHFGIVAPFAAGADRQRRGARAVGCASLLRAGLLRSRQRLLRRVGAHLARSRRVATLSRRVRARRHGSSRVHGEASGVGDAPQSEAASLERGELRLLTRPPPRRPTTRWPRPPAASARPPKPGSRAPGSPPSPPP